MKLIGEDAWWSCWLFCVDSVQHRFTCGMLGRVSCSRRWPRRPTQLSTFALFRSTTSRTWLHWPRSRSRCIGGTTGGLEVQKTASKQWIYRVNYVIRLSLRVPCQHLNISITAGQCSEKCVKELEKRKKSRFSILTKKIKTCVFLVTTQSIQDGWVSDEFFKRYISTI